MGIGSPIGGPAEESDAMRETTIRKSDGRCEAHQDARGRCDAPAAWRTVGLNYGLEFAFCATHRDKSIDLSRSLGGSGGDWAPVAAPEVVR